MGRLMLTMMRWLTLWVEMRLWLSPVRMLRWCLRGQRIVRKARKKNEKIIIIIEKSYKN